MIGIRQQRMVISDKKKKMRQVGKSYNLVPGETADHGAQWGAWLSSSVEKMELGDQGGHDGQIALIGLGTVLVPNGQNRKSPNSLCIVKST